MTRLSETHSANMRSREDARQRILKATRQELAESGWRKFSVDKVARSAKSSKQTIYRTWPDISTMCFEAAFIMIPSATQTGRDPVERISALIEPMAEMVRSGSGYNIMRGALIAASDDPAAGEALRNWLKQHVRNPLRMIMAELATRKVVRRDIDLDAAMEVLMSPFWNRLIIMRAPLSEDFCQDQARRLLSEFSV